MEPRAAKARVASGLIAALVALIAAAAISSAQTATQQTPIKIGFMVPLSGGNAQNGRDILNGFLMYLDEIGYRAGGRKIDLIVEDDEAIPAVGLTKARKLIERDEVHVMAGALLSSTGYALAPYITSMKSGTPTSTAPGTACRGRPSPRPPTRQPDPSRQARSSRTAPGSSERGGEQARVDRGPSRPGRTATPLEPG